MSLGKRLRRYWHGRTAKDPFARSLLSRKYPTLQQTFADATVAVIDLETTGLEPSVAEIASIGWVLVERGVIRVNTLRHELVRVQHGVQQSATIHELFDSELEQGIPCQQALRNLMNDCADYPFVFHGAQLDNTMLSNALQAHFSIPLMQPVIDTLELERRSTTWQKGYVKHGSLRLHECRHRYGLPSYKAHNAAIDALATAELLLAMLAYKGGAGKVKVKELVTH